jgi:hypothetical protein
VSGRDDRIASALDQIEVPAYSAGFWDRLEERLADEPGPRVSPLRRRRLVAPRLAALAAVAAALLLGLVAVRLAGGDDGGTITATDPTSSTVVRPRAGSAGRHLPAQLHAAGATDTPQDAFQSWVAALARGDEPAARALLGPRTVAYYAALGSGIDQAGSSWDQWASAHDRRMDVIDFGEVEGVHVAGLVLERGLAGAGPGASRTDALPMVETDQGWRVEPAAFDPDADSRIEVVRPAPGEQGLTDLVAGSPVAVAVQGAGVYYVGLDQDRLSAFVPADAHDGVIRYEPPSAPAPGTHLLVVAHLSPKVLTILAAPFEVVTAQTSTTAP